MAVRVPCAWIFLIIAVGGALAIKLIAAGQVARQRGSTVIGESSFGWTKASLIGLPAQLLFYAWFYGFGVCALLTFTG